MTKPKPSGTPQQPGRRDFFRLSLGAMTVLCFPYAGCGGDGESEAPASASFPLLWIETGVCTGCGSSLLDCQAPASAELLGRLRLGFYETLMGEYGAQALGNLFSFAEVEAGRFALVVDGAIPVGASAEMTSLGTDESGTEYTAESLVKAIASKAKALVALGTCASFGGIPSANVSPVSYVSLAEVIGKKVVRIPGCPPNPSWIGTALDSLIRGKAIETDALGRPTAIFDKTVHQRCPRLPMYQDKQFATTPGDPEKCLYKVGCKGMMAKGDCPERAWHGRSFCIKAGHPCLACTAPGFLNNRPTVDGIDVGSEGQAASPFYKVMG